jgi:hypothetical protein
LLPILERLNDKNALSARQQERFTERLSELETRTILASGLSTKYCYEVLIKALQSYNWYTQNDAVDMIVSNGPHQAAQLTNEQQVVLGRNILQAADGTAAKSIGLLERLPVESTRWPLGVVLGVALETFANENGDIRIKVRDEIDSVLSAVDNLSTEGRKEVINAIVASVEGGKPSKSSYSEDYHQIACSLSAYEWAAPLVRALKAKLPAD